MNQQELLKLIDTTNKKFSTDFVLGGSWRDKGFSDHDVDVEVSTWDKNTYEAAKFIFKNITQHLDVYYDGCIPDKTNYFFCQDGREGFVKDVPKI